jgi:hypothetical protein
VQRRVLSCRVFLSPILGIKEQLNAVQVEAAELHRVNDDLVRQTVELCRANDDLVW